MPVNQTIAIIGAENPLGYSIAKKLSGLDINLLLMSNQNSGNLVDEIKVLKPKADITTLKCSKDACWEADIIIMDLEEEDVKKVALDIKEVVTQKIILLLKTTAGDAPLVLIQKLFPHSKVIIAYVPKNEIKLPAGSTVIYGSDPPARNEVCELFIRLGFNPEIEAVNINFNQH